MWTQLTDTANSQILLPQKYNFLIDFYRHRPTYKNTFNWLLFSYALIEYVATHFSDSSHRLVIEKIVLL